MLRRGGGGGGGVTKYKTKDEVQHFCMISALKILK